MKQDIHINVDSKDVVLKRNVPTNTVIYETVWGKLFDTDTDDLLYANVIVPWKYEGTVKISQDGNYTCHAHIPYCPNECDFMIRIVIDKGGVYELANPAQLLIAPCISNLENFSLFEPIYACKLPLISIEGYFTIMFRKESAYYDTVARIYSFGITDLNVCLALPQESHLLSICDYGKLYRYPLTGVGITRYINSIVAHTNLAEKTQNEFMADNIPVYSASFNAITGKLSVQASEGTLYREEPKLTDIASLDMSVFDKMTDDLLQYYNTLLPTSGYNWASFLNIIQTALLYNLFYCPKSTMEIEYSTPDYVYDNYGFNNDGSFAEKPPFGVVEQILGFKVPAETLVALESSSRQFLVKKTDEGNAAPLYWSASDANYPEGEYAGKYCVYTKEECVIYIQKTTDTSSSPTPTTSGGLLAVLDINEGVLDDMVIITQNNTTGKLMTYLTSKTNILSVTVNTQNQLITVKRKDE